MFAETSFEVRKQPVFVHNPRRTDSSGMLEPLYAEIPNQFAVVRADNGHILSVMSKDYTPIRDVDVMDKFMELFDQANIEVTPIKHHLTVSKDGIIGRTTLMEVELPAYTINGGLREEHRTRIVIPNSFDGTTKLKMMLMLYRQICSNGAMGWRSEFEFGFRHRAGALDRLGDALNLYMLNQLEQNQLIMNILGNTSGQVDSILNYINNNRILQGERWQEKVLGHWLKINNSANLWDLYNLFTNEITHHYGRNFSSKIVKLKLLNDEVKSTWGRVLGTPDTFIEHIQTI